MDWGGGGADVGMVLEFKTEFAGGNKFNSLLVLFAFLHN